MFMYCCGFCGKKFNRFEGLVYHYRSLLFYLFDMVVDVEDVNVLRDLLVSRRRFGRLATSIIYGLEFLASSQRGRVVKVSTRIIKTLLYTQFYRNKWRPPRFSTRSEEKSFYMRVARALHFIMSHYFRGLYILERTSREYYFIFDKIDLVERLRLLFDLYDFSTPLQSYKEVIMYEIR